MRYQMNAIDKKIVAAHANSQCIADLIKDLCNDFDEVTS